MNPTAAEKSLWAILSRKRIKGLKFTRQKPLGEFIADFYCAELMLVIEIDGDSHSGQEQYDGLRSDILKEKYGIECLRYTNREILEKISGVYEDLLKKIQSRAKETPSNSPLSGGGKTGRSL